MSAGRLRGAAAVHAGYALLFLVVTLASGVWLRSVFVWPASLAGFDFGYLVHAHSHLAFFGWVTPALFALVLCSPCPAGGRGTALGTHAHLLGAASALAFVGFLRMGYAPPTIALSSLHVVLWAGFCALALGPLRRATHGGARFYRAALVLLLVAGAGAMAPGVVEARGIADPWIRQMSLQLFLTPFTAGWLTLGAMGVVYARLERPRFAAPVLVLTLVGVMPSVAAHVVAAPPHAAWTAAGRAGVGLLGVATLLFARDALAGRGLPPLLRLAAVAAAVKGAAEVAVALGLADSLLGARPLVIGYLHLVLLGMVTSVLAGELVAPLRVPAAAALHGAGLALTLAAMGVMGVPGGYALLTRLGGSGPEAHWLAWLGGVLSLLALGGAVAAHLWRGAQPASAAPAARPTSHSAVAARTPAGV